MKVIKIIFIVLLIFASMIGVILGSGYIAANNPLDNSHKHDLVLVEASDPTCTDPGYRKHYACKECGKLFADQTGFGLLEASTVTIAPLGHNVKGASCTEDGICETCQTKVSVAPGHTIVTDAEVPATCTTGGLTEGSHCSACGQVVVAQKATSPAGHKFVSSTDYKCSNCSYVRGEDECPHIVEDMIKDVTPPTCIADGFTTYICSCGYYYVGDLVDALGHTEATLAAVEAGCLSTGLSEGKHCSVCEEVIVAQKTVAAKGVHTWNGLTCTECNATRFETETSDITFEMPAGETKVVSTGREGKTPADTNFPSGDSFVYFMSYSDTTTLTFYVTASKAGKATVSVRMGLATYAAKLENLFYVEVNGVAFENYPDVVFPAWSSSSTNPKYYDWLELQISDIELNEGPNVIKVIKPYPDEGEENPYISTHGLNFDYMAITPEDASMTLQDTRDISGHTYSIVDIGVYPTYEAGGELRVYCENCRLYENITLPKISTENYTKISGDTFSSVWQYTHGDKTFQFTVAEVTQKFTFDVNTSKDPFAQANGGKVVSNGTELSGPTTEDKVDFNYYGNSKNYNTDYTMTIYVSEATTVQFIIGGAKKNSSTYATSTMIKNLKVNGQSTGVKYDSTTLKFGNTEADWHKYLDLSIATLELDAGYNTITFTIKESLNIKYITFESKIAVEPRKQPVTE